MGKDEVREMESGCGMNTQGSDPELTVPETLPNKKRGMHRASSCSLKETGHSEGLQTREYDRLTCRLEFLKARAIPSLERVWETVYSTDNPSCTLIGHCAVGHAFCCWKQYPKDSFTLSPLWRSFL